MTTAGTRLLDGADWAGNIFVEGTWRPGSAGDAAIVEPATGEELGRTGRAGVDDVATAAGSAARPSRSGRRCRTPRAPRCCARQATCSAQYADELAEWNVREVGAIPGMAGFALHVAAEECYAASALPAPRSGELIPSEEPRLSMAKRVPVGVVGVISPFNVPLILSIRSVAPALALGNAVLLKPDPRTVMTGGVNIVRVFEEAGLPAGVLQLVPGGADVGEAIVADPHVRVISFTGSTQPAARSASWPGGTSSERTSSSAATPRCSCSTTPTSRRRSTSRHGARSSTRARSA